MDERKIIKIGGVEFYEDAAPAVGMYIFRRTKIVKVCARKNGTKYGKIVAVTKRLENRGYFHVYDETFTRRYFDINVISDDPRLRDVDIAVKQKEFNEFEEKFHIYFERPVAWIDRADIARFDEWMEKYPVFKMWVEGMEYRRRVEYGRDKFAGACAKYAVLRIWDERY